MSERASERSERARALSELCCCSAVVRVCWYMSSTSTSTSANLPIKSHANRQQVRMKYEPIVWGQGEKKREEREGGVCPSSRGKNVVESSAPSALNTVWRDTKPVPTQCFKIDFLQPVEPRKKKNKTGPKSQTGQWANCKFMTVTGEWRLSPLKDRNKTDTQTEDGGTLQPYQLQRGSGGRKSEVRLLSRLCVRKLLEGPPARARKNAMGGSDEATVLPT